MEYPPGHPLSDTPTVDVRLFLPNKRIESARFCKPIFESKVHALRALTHPKFLSELETQVFDFLFDRFDDCMVFPNVDLDQLFYWTRLRPELSIEEGLFLSRSSHVDICVAWQKTLLPALGIEVDGPHHDLYDQPEKDALKDNIFLSAGIPILRISPRYFKYHSIEQRLAGIVWSVALSLQLESSSIKIPMILTDDIEWPKPDHDEIPF